MLVPALESHSVVDVAKVIKAATAQEKEHLKLKKI